MQAISSRSRFSAILLAIASFCLAVSVQAAAEDTVDAAPKPSASADCKCEATKTPPSDTAKAELMAL